MRAKTRQTAKSPRLPSTRKDGRAARKTAVRVKPRAGLEIRSILIPTDFSAEATKALEYAVPLARLFGAKLTLLHVVEPVATPDFAKSFPIGMDNDRMVAECRERMDRMVKESGLEPELVEKAVVRYGRAFREIAEAARTLKADLILLSTHGYTGMKHALLGSTTERVVRHAPCPVLVVRPHEHEFLMDQQKPLPEKLS